MFVHVDKIACHYSPSRFWPSVAYSVRSYASGRVAANCLKMFKIRFPHSEKGPGALSITGGSSIAFLSRFFSNLTHR